MGSGFCPYVFFEPRVGGLGRAGERLCPGSAASLEAPRGRLAHPPELLAGAPENGKGRDADVAGIKGGAEEAARVDVALYRDRADVLARPAGVTGVDPRLGRGPAFRAKRVERAQVHPGTAHVGQFVQGLAVLGKTWHQVEVLEGDAGQTGKRVGKDAARGKLTYPGLVGTNESRRRAQRLGREARDHLRPLGVRARYLLDLVSLVLERDR